MDMHDRTDADGIANMIRRDDLDSNVDLEEIEKNIVNGNLLIEGDNMGKSAAQKYKETMDAISWTR